jgi:3-hydroxyisobutyrate dehydrogenase
MSREARPSLGFVGIGLMGEAMVRRLLDRAWPVTVWNLEPERLATVVPHGAVAAPSPRAVAEASDIVLMCVLHTAAVESCVFGEGGIAGAASPDKLLVDLSTADPEQTRRMAARLRAETGMGWVDAPVSGGPTAARDGSMTVMAGGEAADTARIGALMADMAGNFTHIGPTGAGQSAKMINQAIVGTGYVLMAEALVLAERAGIDAAKLPACLAGGHADSNLLRKIYPQMQARAFEPPTSYARQLLKDMKNVKDFAHNLGLELPVVEAAVTQYGAYVGQGNEMRDSTSVVRLYEKDASRG